MSAYYQTEDCDFCQAEIIPPIIQSPMHYSDCPYTYTKAEVKVFLERQGFRLK